jgi:hypothetical protein
MENVVRIQSFEWVPTNGGDCAQFMILEQEPADLYKLREDVGELWRESIKADQDPIVEHGRVLRHEAVYPVLVAA